MSRTCQGFKKRKKNNTFHQRTGKKKALNLCPLRWPCNWPLPAFCTYRTLLCFLGVCVQVTSITRLYFPWWEKPCPAELCMAQKVDNSWVLFNKPLRYDDVLQPALNPTSFLFPSTSNTLALSTCHFHMFSKSLPIFPHIGPAIFHLLLILPLPEASPLWTLRQTSWPANFSCFDKHIWPLDHWHPTLWPSQYQLLWFFTD